MSLENKKKIKSSNSIQENNNLWNKMVKQTYHKVLSVWWTVTPLFGSLHSVRASPQKAPLGLIHVQDP